MHGKVSVKNSTSRTSRKSRKAQSTKFVGSVKSGNVISPMSRKSKKFGPGKSTKHGKSKQLGSPAKTKAFGKFKKIAQNDESANRQKFAKNAKSRKANNEEKYGVVIVKNFPDGFYEDQMFGYFSQYGDVLKVFIPRSENSCRPKSVAFVVFAVPEVAKIAAETMDGYFMFGKLLRCQYDPNFKCRFDLSHDVKPLSRETVMNLIQSEGNREISEDVHVSGCHEKKMWLLGFQEQFKDLGIAFDVDLIIDDPDKFLSKPVADKNTLQQITTSQAVSKSSRLYIDTSDREISFKKRKMTVGKRTTKKVVKPLPAAATPESSNK